MNRLCRKMRTKHLLLIGMILLSGDLAFSSDPKAFAEQASRSETSLLYIARRLGISILKADIKIESGSFEQGKTVCRTEAHVNSINLGFLFHMNNHFLSLVETETFTPIRYVKKIDQGGFLRERKNYQQTITFDPIQGKGIVEQKGERKEVRLPPNTSDPLSILARYYLKEELRPGQDLHLSIYDGVRLRDMVFQSQKERVLTTLYGEIEAVRLESTTSFSAFEDKEGRIRIWYTADRQKIPVSMELELPVGSVMFDLERIERK
jgi:hypothetical protein